MGDDLDAVREALAARLDACWDRLADVVSELRALHSVPTAEIVERVVQASAEEDDSQTAAEGRGRRA